MAGDVGPCSAWPSRSVAQISPSTVSSAMTSVSVGPATGRSRPSRTGGAWPRRRKRCPAPRASRPGRSSRSRAPSRRSPERRPDVDLVGAGEVHRCNDRGVRLALERRRARDHSLDAGDLGRDDRHMRGGDHRVAAAGHIAADRSPGYAGARAEMPGSVSTSRSLIVARWPGRSSAPAPARTGCRRARDCLPSPDLTPQCSSLDRRKRVRGG